MALQDLTPQLRTRLNRMEKIIGWFILVATLMMIVGFVYYLYRAADARGWFEVKAEYWTYADSAEGLSAGDPVELMGFKVGHITSIAANAARGKGSEHNVSIKMVVIGTNFNYIWTGNSRVRFVSSPLGGVHLDITKGTNGYNTYMDFPLEEMTVDAIKASPNLPKLRLGQEVYQGTNVAINAWKPLSNNVDKLGELGLTKVWTIDTTTRSKGIVGVWNETEHHYETFAGTNAYILAPDTEPALMDRLNGIVGQVEDALPNFLKLTNQLAATLANSEQLTSNLNAVAAGLRPAISDVSVITANLRDPHGSLGAWLIPTNVNEQLAATLLNANGTVTNVNMTITNVNTNLLVLFDDVGHSLMNLADITSNLNRQVQDNSNMLSEITRIVVNSDDFVQGLKRHWLLRSAFKPAKTNAVSPRPVAPKLRK